MNSVLLQSRPLKNITTASCKYRRMRQVIRRDPSPSHIPNNAGKRLGIIGQRFGHIWAKSYLPLFLRAFCCVPRAPMSLPYTPLQITLRIIRKRLQSCRILVRCCGLSSIRAKMSHAQLTGRKCSHTLSFYRFETNEV